MVVDDTSVVVKWYIPERDHDQARALRDAYLDGRVDLAAPALMPFEAITALQYSGHYEGTRLEEASRSLPEYDIELVPFANCGPVAEIASTLDITVYDAAYVALARRLDTIAYTADGSLLDDLDGDFTELAEHIRTYWSEGIRAIQGESDPPRVARLASANELTARKRCSNILAGGFHSSTAWRGVIHSSTRIRYGDGRN